MINIIQTNKNLIMFALVSNLKMEFLLFDDYNSHTLSGRIGKVVAAHAEVVGSIPDCAGSAPIYTMHEDIREYFP